MTQDRFVIFFASFSYEGGKWYTGTTGADVSLGLESAVDIANDRADEFRRCHWVQRAVIHVVCGSDGETVHRINWSRNS